jgi:hypothetical protein
VSNHHRSYLLTVTIRRPVHISSRCTGPFNGPLAGRTGAPRPPRPAREDCGCARSGTCAAARRRRTRRSETHRGKRRFPSPRQFTRTSSSPRPSPPPREARSAPAHWHRPLRPAAPPAETPQNASTATAGSSSNNV